MATRDLAASDVRRAISSRSNCAAAALMVNAILPTGVVVSRPGMSSIYTPTSRSVNTAVVRMKSLVERYIRSYL